MGYDCTLHVVDEKRIRSEFVPRLLGLHHNKSSFDRRPDAAALWKEVGDALSDADKDPEEVASQVCQLAVAYCSAELPYHYERGFCLSLWPDQPDDLDATVPKKFIGDPESLFTEVIAAHPRLRGKFPKEIGENWSTGLFVPSEAVPALFKWVERRVKGYSKPKQRLFRGLSLVLKQAADHGLAYWEGTDLPVDMNVKAPRDEQRMHAVDEFEGPKDLFLHFLAQFGATLVFTTTSGTAQEWCTVLADFRELPPKISSVKEYPVAVDCSRNGRWVTVAMVADEPYVYRVRTSDSPTGKKTVLSVPPERNGKIRWAGFVGELIVAVMEIDSKKAVVPSVAHALVEKKGRLERAKELQPRSKENRYRYHGIVRLNDGSDLFIWNGDAYEVHDGRFQLSIPLSAKGFDDSLPYTAYDTDTFFYLSEARLFSVRRGESPCPHLPTVENIISVSAGPMGSLLLRQGTNKHGDLGKLYFPEAGAFLRVGPEWFPDEDPDDINSLHWISDCDRLVASTGERFWAVMGATALAHQRYQASNGRKLKN